MPAGCWLETAAKAPKWHDNDEQLRSRVISVIALENFSVVHIVAYNQRECGYGMIWWHIAATPAHVLPKDVQARQHGL